MVEPTGKENDSKRFLRIIGLLIFVLFVTIMFPYFLGLGQAGFDDPQIIQLMLFYGVFGLGSAMVILLGAFMQERIKQGDARYGSSIMFNSPGEGPSPSFLRKVKAFRNPISLLMLSIIIFGIIGIFLGSTNQSFTGSVLATQQFTQGEELGFRSFLIPGIENMGGAAVIVGVILLWTWFARRQNLNRGVFLAGEWIFILVAYILYWITNHQLRYGSSDISIFAQVAPFGLLIALLTLFTGSFIPGWIAHVSNNFFFEAFKLFSSDLIFVFSIVLIIVLIALEWIFLGFVKEKKNE